MNFVGKAERLTAADFVRVSEYLGCELATIRAVVDVEARGKGFDKNKRPIILFEPHIFYRELGPGEPRNMAVSQRLAARRWGDLSYPRTQETRYAKLESAIVIDRDAALKSASWGLGQVMGFNHQAAGYGSVTAFVQAMCQSEYNQLMAMASFIRSKRLDKPLQRKDWTSFARGYNGAGYRKNRYHEKLAAAYDRRSKRNPVSTKSEIARQRRIKEAQGLLADCGYQSGHADGILGPRTEAAVKSFQRDLKLAVTGLVDEALLAALRKAKVRSKSQQAQEVPQPTRGAKEAERGKGWLAALRKAFPRSIRTEVKFTPTQTERNNEMNGLKPWFLSRGILGGLVTVAASLGGLVGIEVQPSLSEEVTSQLVLTVTAIGGLVSVLGRFFATSQIAR